MSETLTKEKNDIYEWMNEGWTEFNSNALYDTERYLGCADSADAAKAQRQGRSYLPMNKIKRQINFLCGHEIKNRHILKITPIGREDDKACQQHTGLVMQQMACFGGYDTLSDCFKMGSLVSGSNLLEIWKDRNGNIRFGRLGFNEFVLTPDFRNGDLSDCSSIIIAKWLDPNKINYLVPQGSDKVNIDDSVPFSTERWPYLPKPILTKDKRKLYEEWWHKETKYIDTVISNVSGQEIPYTDFAVKYADGDKGLADYLIKNTKLPSGKPAGLRYKKPYDVVKLSIFVDDNLIYDGDNPLGTDEFNHIWLHGEYIPEIDRSELKLQSFARILREPSILNDRRMNQAMDIIETQIQSGRIFRDQYLKNPKDAYKSGQGVFLHIKDVETGGPPLGTPLDQIFMQLPATEISGSFFNIMEIIEKNEDSIGGLNADALGAADDPNVPAIMSMFRTGQALTGQQGVFQSFRTAKRQVGIKLVKINQVNFQPEKVQRYINELPVQGFYEPDFNKYDCVPTEGILTETQQNLFYLELKEIRERYPDAAQIIPISALIEASPMQFKDRLAQIIKQQEQRAMQMQQVAMQDKQRQDKLMDAHTMTKIASAQESISQAAENRTTSILDRARTMTEMQKLQNDSVVSAQKPQLEILDRVLRLEELMQKQQKLQLEGLKIRNDNRNNRNKGKRR